LGRRYRCDSSSAHSASSAGTAIAYFSGTIAALRPQCGERGCERGDAVVAALRTRIDRTFDDAGQPPRHVGAHRQHVAAVAAVVRRTQIRQAASAHRVRPGHHVVKQHADAVNLALNRRVTATKQLGCEIQRRAGQSVGRGARVAHFPAGAEVHQHRTPVGREHHVLRLDVTVQQTGFMDC
jgi:hypothetical protein